MAKETGRKKVEVTWLDSHTRSGWQTVESGARFLTEELDLVCKSIGYVFAESDDNLVIIMSMGEPDLVHSLMTIPKVAVIKVRTLK